ncbi:hypothetical protein ACQPX6_24545 [Actinomycetospora sp. CA-101289]|uniref:hypothetical protein n=1 Tax=Actinomycetospora sp. CA-101289 TaxID=3239893 RepID=UPI003D9713A9
MLKKAGIVVLGAAAGMLSLAPLASAGEASHGGGHDNDHGHHGEHDRDRGHGHRGGGDCGDFALSQGDSLVNASNLLANADVEDIAILGSNSGDDDDCGGGGRGHGRDGGHGHGGGHRGGGDGDTAVSQGNSLINASNLLANADVSDIAVLGSNS